MPIHDFLYETLRYPPVKDSQESINIFVTSRLKILTITSRLKILTSMVFLRNKENYDRDKITFRDK